MHAALLWFIMWFDVMKKKKLFSSLIPKHSRKWLVSHGGYYSHHSYMFAFVYANSHSEQQHHPLRHFICCMWNIQTFVIVLLLLYYEKNMYYVYSLCTSTYVWGSGWAVCHLNSSTSAIERMNGYVLAQPIHSISPTNWNAMRDPEWCFHIPSDTQSH